MGGTCRAERESDEGYDEIECAMPAVLTCAERVAQPIRVKPEAAEEAKRGRSRPCARRRSATDPSYSALRARRPGYRRCAQSRREYPNAT